MYTDMTAGASTSKSVTTASTAQAIRFDARNLEIKTKSIEATLVPLVQQITTLVNHKERLMGKPRTDKAVRTAMKVRC
jgi:hypothetical protein